MAGIQQRCVLVSLLLGFVVSLSTAHAEAEKTTKDGSIAVRASDTVFQVAVNTEETVWCLSRGHATLAGALVPETDRFLPFDVVVAKKQKKMRRKIGRLKERGTNPERVTKLRKETKALKRQSKLYARSCYTGEVIPTTTPTPLPTPSPTPTPKFAPPPIPCDIRAEPQVVSVREHGSVVFNLYALSHCTDPIAYTIEQAPAIGTLSGSGSHYSYQAEYGAGSVELVYRACHPDPLGCTEPTKVIISVAGADFVGRRDDLTRYRSTLTRKEAKHLIKKLALNAHWLLEDELLAVETIDIDTLIGRIMDPLTVSPDLKDLLEAFQRGRNGQPAVDPWGNVLLGSAQQFVTPSQQHQGLETLLNTYAKGYNSTAERLRYTANWSSPLMSVRARYLSPAWMQMTHLWAGHFGTAIHSYGSDFNEHFIRDYTETLYDNALGNFRTMVLGANPNGCLSATGGTGILCDAASNVWLSNQFNTRTSKNQNFARELMELYLLSPIDRFTGLPNYGEDDIVAATAYVSGMKLQNYASTIDHGGPLAGRAVTRQRLVYDSARHDSARYTAFAGTPYAYTGSATPTQFAQHLFSSHPALPKFIAGKLFGMLAYPDPSEEVVTALAGRFKASNYNIADLFYAIATSEAMFSEHAAQPNCIKEPFKIFVETSRNLQLPFFDYNSLATPLSIHRWGATANMIRDFDLTVARAGENVLLYPTVFTHRYCGRNPGETGDEWVYASRLVRRVIGMIDQVGMLSTKNSVRYDIRNIAKLGLDQSEDLSDLTPERLLLLFNELYGIETSREEHAVLLKYLTTSYTPEEGEVPVQWNPTNRAFLKEKVAGIAVIYASMSQSNVE